MIENGINIPSPSGEFQISSNRYQLEYSAEASILSPNIWNTIGTLPSGIVKPLTAFNFEKSVVIMREGSDNYYYPLCEQATTVQCRFIEQTGAVQVYFTSQPLGFRICIEYSK